MSEFNKVIKQNAMLTFNIVSLIETLDKNIKDLQEKHTCKDKYYYIKIYRDLKRYLEEVLEVSYGKSNWS